MNLNDFNFPFYWVNTLMFLGLAWSSSGFFKAAGQKHLHVLWLAASCAMAFACLGYGLLPWVGRTILGFSSMAIMASVAVMYLIVRAWRTPLTRRVLISLGGVLLVAFVVSNALLHFSTFKLRVLFLIIPSVLILLWGIYEGWMLGRLHSSDSHKFLLTTQVVLCIVTVTWEVWAILVSPSIPEAKYGDPQYVEVGRLLVVSLILVLMVSMAGLAMELMRRGQVKLLEEKHQADALNKKLAWTLQERNQMLKALTFSSKARNAHALVSNLAHEMNQPLGSIRLFADHLMHSPEMSHEQKQDVLASIVLGIERAQHSLRDFRLFFSTQQSDDQVVRLDELTQEILDTFADELREDCIDLKLQIQAPLSVEVDVVQLKMVVLNLLTNAMDALREHDGPRVVTIRLWRDRDLACFSMQDSGPGVPSALREKVFTSYFSTKELGIGLGLWLCRAIVEYFGGTMSAELDGPGARFEFKIPVAVEKD